MAEWTSNDLDVIGSAEEIRIGAERPSGGLGRWTPIWVVQVGEDLYVRAGSGLNGEWYRRATHSQAHILADGIDRKVKLELRTDPDLQKAVDEAYRSKYRTSSFLRSLVSATAQTSTSRLVPLA